MSRTHLARFARLLSPALMGAALLVSGGCAYFSATPPLDAAGNEVQVAADLPVPQGFAMDKAASRRHERDGYRRYDLTYRRNEYLSEARVREFVYKAFPQAGWKVRFVWGVDDSHFLLTRGAEECEIYAHEDFGDRFTQLEVAVRPRETPDGMVVSRKSLDSKGSAADESQLSVPASAKR